MPHVSTERRIAILNYCAFRHIDGWSACSPYELYLLDVAAYEPLSHAFSRMAVYEV